MSLSKQIILVAAAFLGLSAQLNVSAYNVAQLKDEVMLIQHYANHWTPLTDDLREWLINTIDSTYLTSNQLIVSIAATIKDRHLSGSQKNNQLYYLKYKDDRKWHTYSEIAQGALIGAYIAFMGHELYNFVLRKLESRDELLLFKAYKQTEQLIDAERKKQIAIDAECKKQIALVKPVQHKFLSIFI